MVPLEQYFYKLEIHSNTSVLDLKKMVVQKAMANSDQEIKRELIIENLELCVYKNGEVYEQFLDHEIVEKIEQ